MTSHDQASVLAEAAEQMGAARTLEATLTVVAATARDALPAIDHVGVTLVERDERWSTSAATDDVVRAFDDLQYELRQGPCVDALTGSGTAAVVLQDARRSSHWRTYVPRAVRLGLRSQLALQLRVDGRAVGGLNMYSTTADRIDVETITLAPLLATHASLAIGHARQVDNLHKALSSREVIGQAVGITMSQFGLGSDAAFNYLVRMSATSECKLRDVAISVIAASGDAAQKGPTR